MRRTSSKFLLASSLALYACSADPALDQRGSALVTRAAADGGTTTAPDGGTTTPPSTTPDGGTTTPPSTAPGGSGYRDLRPPTIGDQDEGRRQGVQNGIIQVPAAMPPPAPTDALAALQKALVGLQAALPTSSADKQQIHQLIGAVDGIAAGKLSLALNTFCLSSTGVQKWLDTPRRIDPAVVGATRAALDGVCSQTDAFQNMNLPYNDDPFVDWTVPPKLFVDGPECAQMFVSTPDAQPNQYALESYIRDPGQPGVPLLEEGQSFGAIGQCQSTATRSYGMAFTLTYRGITAKLTDFTTGLLHAVHMPADVVPPKQVVPTGAILVAQTVRQDCDNAGCKNTNLGNPQAYWVTISPVGSFCSVSTKYSQFSVNDRTDANWQFEWQTSQATSISGPAVDWTTEFRAYAWVPKDVTPPGYPFGKIEASSAPIYTPIVEGDRFAVHSHDHFSLFDQVNPKYHAPHSREEYVGQVGALDQSGMLFPRIVGFNWNNGGTPFSYTCAPKAPLRDYVAFCTSATPKNQPPDFDPNTDSFYLYPYNGDVFVIQGNGGILSHNVPWEEYAYDFDTEVGTNDRFAYAARGGVVISVLQEYDGHVPYSSFYDCTVDANNAQGLTTNPSCDNNMVVIQHADGTTANYLHIEHHGALVKVGDIVQRGQKIAKSGNVGNSGVRHIHFDVHNGKDSIPSRFDGGSHACSKAHYADWPDGTLGKSYPVAYREWLYNDYGLPLKR